MKSWLRLLGLKSLICVLRKHWCKVYLIHFLIIMINYCIQFRTAVQVQAAKKILVVAIISDSSQLNMVSFSAAGILLCRVLNYRNLSGLERVFDTLKGVIFFHLDHATRLRRVAAYEMEVRKILIVQTLGLILIVFVDYILYTVEGYNPLVWVIILAMHLPGHIINAFNIYFNSKLVLIKHMYRAIHTDVDPDSITTVAQYTVFIIKEQYLQRATELLNKTLVLQKLCLVLAYFTMCTADVYFLAYITLTNHERYRGKLGPRLYRVFSITHCMLRIIFTIRLTERIKAERKSGIRKAHETLMKNSRVPFKNKIMAYSFEQLHHYNRDFFELNYAFLYDVIGAIFINLFFLLQFQLSLQ